MVGMFWKFAMIVLLTLAGMPATNAAAASSDLDGFWVSVTPFGDVPIAEYLEFKDGEVANGGIPLFSGTEPCSDPSHCFAGVDFTVSNIVARGDAFTVAKVEATGKFVLAGEAYSALIAPNLFIRPGTYRYEISGGRLRFGIGTAVRTFRKTSRQNAVNAKVPFLMYEENILNGYACMIRMLDDYGLMQTLTELDPLTRFLVEVSDLKNDPDGEEEIKKLRAASAAVTMRAILDKPFAELPFVKDGTITEAEIGRILKNRGVTDGALKIMTDILRKRQDHPIYSMVKCK